MIRSLTKSVCFAVICALFAGSALAAPIKATVDFPQGLVAGQEVEVRANLEGAVDGLKGSPVAMVYETGQDSESIQVELGKIGEELKGKFKPRSGPARITLRFSGNGQNFAQVANLNASGEAQPTGLEFEFDETQPQSRAYTPAPILLWVLGAVMLGLIALRGVKYAF